MFRLSLKNIWAYKSRLLLSMISIILGVAFLSGTLVFSATIENGFNDLFSKVFKDIDVVVRSADTTTDQNGFETPQNVPRNLVDEVRKVKGVRLAEGSISSDNITVIDEEGKRAFSSNGPPTFGMALGHEEELNPWRLVDENGNSLSSKQTVATSIADNEVLVSQATADLKDYKVGSMVKVVLPNEVREYRIIGFVRFGTSDSMGGVNSFIFNDKQATDIAGKGNTYSDITVKIDSGFSRVQVKNNIEKALSNNKYGRFEALTGEELTKETQDQFSSFIGIFTTILLVFAGISFLVALIIIVNSFAIIMTQRKQEYALLRAVGAKPSQIRRSVFIEATIVGFVSSIIGIISGIGLAKGIRSLLDATGSGLPSGGLIVPSSAVIVGLLVGTLSTLGASLFPAWMSSRIAPIEALRDSAFEKHKSWKWRFIAVGVVGLITILLLVNAFTTDKSEIKAMGMAIAGVFILALISIPLFVKPFTKIIGSRIGGVFLILFGGRHAFNISGDIARRNNYRNPRRSGRTALALMIGVSLVVFITVFVSSASATFTKYLDDNFASDFFISDNSASTTLTSERCDGLEKLDQVQGSTCLVQAPAVVTLNYKEGDSNNKSKSFTIASINSSAFNDVFSTEYEGTPTNLGTDGIAVGKKFAENNDLILGSKVRIGGDNKQIQIFSVKSILDEPVFGFDIAMDNDAFVNLYAPKYADIAMVTLKDGVSAADGQKVLDNYFANTGLEVNDLKSLRDQQLSQINGVLMLFYGLLGLAIVIASIGIVNTMSLSILERRRELGLMRAIGTTKSQVRAFIRFESVIVAVMGTLMGMATGTICSWLFYQALKDQGFDAFAVDFGSMITILFISAIIGVLAGAWPAWRATKIDVLKAVTVE